MKMQDLLTSKEKAKVKHLKKKMREANTVEEYTDCKIYIALLLKNSLLRYPMYKKKKATSTM